LPARVLVAYGTKYGSTSEIAEAIGATLAEAGLEVDVERARNVKSIDPYDAVVLGSAVYMRRWRRDAARLLRRRKQLAARELWLFSSGPVGEDPDNQEKRRKAESWQRPKAVEAAASTLGAHEHAVFGGRVDEDGGFMRKSMARNTPAELRDRRDWEQVRAWAHEIASALRATGPAREDDAR
jgi:menaquinone-dependent protoporphyrinogen oxidase